jgi:tetratricopeptide (TPR) repeat protein
MLTASTVISVHASNSVPMDQGEEPNACPLSSLFQGNSQDQLAGAFTKLNAAIEANPNNAKLYEERAALKSLRRDFKAAIEDANRAAEIDPADADAYKLRAWVRAVSQDFSGAASDYDRAIELKPGDATHSIGVVSSGF